MVPKIYSRNRLRGQLPPRYTIVLGRYVGDEASKRQQLLGEGLAKSLLPRRVVTILFGSVASQAEITGRERQNIIGRPE